MNVFLHKTPLFVWKKMKHENTASRDVHQNESKNEKLPGRDQHGAFRSSQQPGCHPVQGNSENEAVQVTMAGSPC